MGLKKACGKVRFVQDLRKVNDMVVKCCPVVLNPAVILVLFQIPCDAEWFTVYSWCRLPQGYTESPSLFKQILKKNLESLELLYQSTRVQYIYDLLIASRTREEFKYDSIALLNHLGKFGHKGSPLKLQCCQKSVKYLGHLIEKGSRRISRERITMILQKSPPTSQRDVRMFLGMVGYCRQWIPNFAGIAKPLQQLTHKEVTNPITLDEDQMKAFTELRDSLCSAPALGMPDYTKPFTLFRHERDACSLSVLTQVHGGAYRPVAYFSATLDPVAAALPGCLRAVAAVGKSLSQCEGVVMGYPLTVMVPHSVEILLTRTETQYLNGARLTRFAGFQRGQQSIPWQKVKREMQRNSDELLHSLSKESQETEALILTLAVGDKAAAKPPTGRRSKICNSDPGGNRQHSPPT
ncbi:hypothetical protein NDU88_003176 [Pleurodeles waltl]|uniref:ribonuclease H n=1 Tax=Pleurodeles waltl TaxID=8319 RepID=A0AAV7L5C8_PLEWA|nr:hypothetical protein NDU88_003176 [Pleurodeles waltl]